MFNNLMQEEGSLIISGLKLSFLRGRLKDKGLVPLVYLGSDARKFWWEWRREGKAAQDT